MDHTFNKNGTLNDYMIVETYNSECLVFHLATSTKMPYDD